MSEAGVDPTVDEAAEVDPVDAVQKNAANAGVVLPSFISWDGKKAYNYDEQVVDYSSLEELGAAITKARMSLFLITDKINVYERHEKRARVAYDRSYRRAYLESMGRTEGEKKMRAALKCEELENEWLKYEQVKEELVRLSYAMKTELQTLQTIANNLRQQLRI